MYSPAKLRARGCRNAFVSDANRRLGASLGTAGPPQRRSKRHAESVGFGGKRTAGTAGATRLDAWIATSRSRLPPADAITDVGAKPLSTGSATKSSRRRNLESSAVIVACWRFMLLGELVRTEHLGQRAGHGLHAVSSARMYYARRRQVGALLQAQSRPTEQDTVVILDVDKFRAGLYRDPAFRFGQRGCDGDGGEHHRGAVARDTPTRPQHAQLVRRTTQDIGMAQCVE